MTGAWRERVKAGKPAAGGRQNGRAGTGSPRLNGSAKRFADARKSGTRVIPAMERWMLAQPDDRLNESVLHVSDLTKNTWCPRMLFHRLLGVRPELDPKSFQLQNILDYGSDAHDKFQRRWWDMGVLWGRWYCYNCNQDFMAQSPIGCPLCHTPKFAVRYREVPLERPELLLVGNADGELRDAMGVALVEVKTVAEGTFRVEVPKLLAEYTHKITWPDGHTESLVDIKNLWKDLRRPIPSHGRQGQTYAEMRRVFSGQPPVDGISVIYEHKGNQGIKEFWLEPDPTVAAEVFDRAADVEFAISRRTPPRCPEGRDGCDLCKPYEELVRRGNGTQAPPRARRTVLSGGHPI